MCSSHLKSELGSGGTNDITNNIINVPLVPLWSSDINIKPIEQQEKAEGAPSGNRRSKRLRAGAALNNGACKTKKADEEAPICVGRLAWRRGMVDRVLPALHAFQPGLILISAGFDSALGDEGNSKEGRWVINYCI